MTLAAVPPRTRFAAASLIAVAALGLGIGAWADNDQPVVFEVPKLETLTIDGHSQEWPLKLAELGRINTANGQNPDPNARFEAMLSIGWTEEGLAFLVRITDEKIVPPPQEVNELYLYDSVELFIANGQQKVQFIIAPTKDGMRFSPFEHRTDGKLREAAPLKVHAAVVRTDTGYNVEALLPWKLIGIEPEVGTQIAAQVIVNNTDLAGRDRTIHAWFPEPDTYRNTAHMHQIRLVPGRHNLASAAAGDHGT